MILPVALRTERVDRVDAGCCNVCCIASDERQAVLERRCGEKSIDRGKWLIESQPAPALADRQCHREDSLAIVTLESAEPAVQRSRGWAVSSTKELDTSPKLAYDQDAQEELVGFAGVKPTSNAGIRPVPLSEFRYDVRIDQVAAHRSTDRRLASERSNAASSPTSGMRAR